MATPQATNFFEEDEQPKALEEPVNAELEQLLNDYKNPYKPEFETDVLNGRFVVHVNEALPDLAGPFAKAYKATDQSHPERNIYALCLEPTFDYRQTMLEAMDGYLNTNMLTQFGYGEVYLSHEQCVKMTVIYERPEGRRLSDMLKERPLGEHQIYEVYMDALNNALTLFREQKLVHGNIHPRNIYVGDKIKLGECISEPCGYSQEFYYEAYERAIAKEDGKGNGNKGTDAYALAILVLDMVGHLNKARKIDREAFIDRVITYGSYQLLANKLEISEIYEDLLRGCLNENVEERWNLINFDLWVKGRRSNLIPPTSHRDGNRPFSYKGEEVHSMRVIADRMARDWQVAMRELEVSKLGRWLEMAVHDPDIAEHADRFITSNMFKRNENAKAEAVARLIEVLDPNGPIRFRQLKTHLDAFGRTMIAAKKDGRNADITAINYLIHSDFHAFWMDLYPLLRPENSYRLMWQMQKAKEVCMLQAMGFGVERMVYELNDLLPCQYALLKPYHVTNLSRCLYMLDYLAKENRLESLADRELAAFLACKLGINKELGFRELSSLESLQRHPELVVIRMLGQAQVTAKTEKLVGLSAWCALRISNLLNEFNNRKTRKLMRKQLKNAAMSGKINNVMGILVNKHAVEGDVTGYNKAQLIYQYNNARISTIQNPTMRGALADDLGHRIATFISYMILFFTIFILFNEYETDIF